MWYLFTWRYFKQIFRKNLTCCCLLFDFLRLFLRTKQQIIRIYESLPIKKNHYEIETICINMKDYYLWYVNPILNVNGNNYKENININNKLKGPIKKFFILHCMFVNRGTSSMYVCICFNHAISLSITYAIS